MEGEKNSATRIVKDRILHYWLNDKGIDDLSVNEVLFVSLMEEEPLQDGGFVYVWGVRIWPEPAFSLGSTPELPGL
jgi:hypothetical protein